MFGAGINHIVGKETLVGTGLVYSYPRLSGEKEEFLIFRDIVADTVLLSEALSLLTLPRKSKETNQRGLATFPGD